MILDLDQLLAEANAWLRALPCERALDAQQIAFFRARFCLPPHVMAMLRIADGRPRDGEGGGA